MAKSPAYAPKPGTPAAFALAKAAPEIRQVLFDLLEALQKQQMGEDVGEEIGHLRAAGVEALRQADVFNQ